MLNLFQVLSGVSTGCRPTIWLGQHVFSSDFLNDSRRKAEATRTALKFCARRPVFWPNRRCRAQEFHIAAHVEREVAGGESRAIRNENGELETEFEELLELVTVVPGTLPSLGYESRADILSVAALEQDLGEFLAHHLLPNDEESRHFVLMASLFWHDHLKDAEKRIQADLSPYHQCLAGLTARRLGTHYGARGSELLATVLLRDLKGDPLYDVVGSRALEFLTEQQKTSEEFGVRIVAKRLLTELFVDGLWDPAAMVSACQRVQGGFEDPAYELLQECQAIEWETLLGCVAEPHGEPESGLAFA